MANIFALIRHFRLSAFNFIASCMLLNMKDMAWKFFQTKMKRWTRSGVIEFLDEQLDHDNSEEVLVIGGKGPILDYISNMNLSGKIKTLDINPDHAADYTMDIANSLQAKEVKEKFYKVIAIEVLEHVTDYTAALKNISLFLNKNGILVASTPWIIPLHDTPSDFHRFTWYEISRMLEVAGFGDIKIESRGNYFDSILALGVRGFLGISRYHKLLGMIFIFMTSVLPKPKRYNTIQYSCIGYNFSARR